MANSAVPPHTAALAPTAISHQWVLHAPCRHAYLVFHPETLKHTEQLVTLRKSGNYACST